MRFAAYNDDEELLFREIERFELLRELRDEVPDQEDVADKMAGNYLRDARRRSLCRRTFSYSIVNHKKRVRSPLAYRRGCWTEVRQCLLVDFEQRVLDGILDAFILDVVRAVFGKGVIGGEAQPFIITI